MMRITATVENSTALTLKVEGKIMEVWVNVFEEECIRWLSRNPIVRVDLSQVSYIDHCAVLAFYKLREKGLVIIECPTFIEELLKQGKETS